MCVKGKKSGVAFLGHSRISIIRSSGTDERDLSAGIAVPQLPGLSSRAERRLTRRSSARGKGKLHPLPLGRFVPKISIQSMQWATGPRRLDGRTGSSSIPTRDSPT